jgi:3-phosphoshikimate 1-carboxyvinyltransferase
MRISVGRVEGIRGELIPPPSKFFTQFSIALALVSEGRSEIRHPLSVADTTCLLSSIQKLGGAVKKSEGKWVIWGTAGSLSPTVGVLDAKNSATALSFLSSLSSLAKRVMVITGDPQLRSRPLPELLQGLRKIGVSVLSTKEDSSPPFVVMGADMRGGRVEVKIPDKYLPALLLACLFGKSEYQLKVRGGERLEMAATLLKASGISIRLKGTLKIPNEVPRGFKVTIPRDPDLLAPFITLALLTDSRLRISGRGRFVSLLELFKIRMENRGGKCIVEGPQHPKPASLDVSEFPQFFPFLCVLACFAKGTSVFSGLSSVRGSKSDRVSVMVNSLRKMGAKIKEEGDRVLVTGPCRLEGCEVDAGGDPCTTASLIVAGALAEGETIVLNGVQSLRTTYPNLLGSFRKLGVDVSLC